MSNVDLVTGADFPSPRGETAAEKDLRLAREAEMIAEARASVAAGRVVSFEAVSAWIDSLDTDHEPSRPQSRR
jgi:predicted transcriptional regulator